MVVYKDLRDAYKSVCKQSVKSVNNSADTRADARCGPPFRSSGALIGGFRRPSRRGVVIPRTEAGARARRELLSAR